MWLLDSDHLTILERGGGTALALQMRLGQVPPEQLATTIINYEEQMRGWMSLVAHANTPQKLIVAYGFLQQHIGTFSDTPMLACDAQAASVYKRLRQTRIRIGTRDLRIAAICLAQNATLLTRNLSHFSQIPGLRAEDWSV